MTHELEALAGSLPGLRETLANAVAERDAVTEHLASLNAVVASVEKRVSAAEDALRTIKGPVKAEPKPKAARKPTLSTE